MSHRPIWLGTVAMLGALAVGGGGLADASVQATAAKKHHKKHKKHHHKKHHKGGGGGTAIFCHDGTASGQPNEGAYYYQLGFTCDKTFSSFTFSGNKALTGNAHADAYTGGATMSLLGSVSCPASGGSFTCSGLPSGTGAILAQYSSSQACSTPPYRASVTVDGKSFALTASC